jgi:DNA polymerase-3 subunit gamma/tau
MSYTALARKWRPKKFAELVGQEHVRRALVNALETGRVHHAFLFTGTRGVGKTTIARIFAKCLNCETGVTPEPCGVCGACKDIDSGRFVDLIEVDAASRTKVDDTRELLDNVPYAPTRGRYKVYLIDEVHMLSTHSFNALLKTLEEPPPHMKFLLATTDPQKLPATVLSRCLQFNLKRMPVGQIAEHMKALLEKEGVPFEPAGLRLVAQAADGSMRDGLSLLDQLIAFGGGKAGEEEARAMLGTISRDHVERLAELLGSMNVPELMQCSRSLEEFAPDYAQVLDELAGLLVRVAMKQTISDFEGDDLYAPELLERLAKALSPEDIQLYYQTAITGRRDLVLAPDPRTGFEMTLLRMIAFRPANDAGAGQGPATGSGNAAGRGAAAAQVAAQAAAQGGGARGGSAAPYGAQSGGGSAAAGSFGAQAGGGAGSFGGQAGGGGAGSPSAQAGNAAAAARAAAQGGAGGAAAARAAAQAAARGAAPSGAAGPRGSVAVGASAASGPAGGSAPGAGSSAGRMSDADAEAEWLSGQHGEDTAATPAAAMPGGAADSADGSWIAILNQLDLQGAARQLASHCVLVGRQPGLVRLALDPRVKFVRTSSQEEKLAQALSRHYGETVRLEFTTASGEAETPAQADQRASQQELDVARQAFETDPAVKSLRERFGATLLPDTIRPVK